MELYPVHLQLKGRTALVVGGGPVAADKAVALLQGGACVRIVAPALSDEMRLLVDDHMLHSDNREFEPDDLKGVWVVVAATDRAHVQKAVYDEARKRDILVCIVDDPARSDFIVPAVLRRGELIVTVSTSGVAPALSSRIRDYIGEFLGDSAGRMIEDLKPFRERLRKEFPEFARRRQAWYELLDSKVMPALRRTRLADPPVGGASGGEEDS